MQHNNCDNTHQKSYKIKSFRTYNSFYFHNTELYLKIEKKDFNCMVSVDDKLVIKIYFSSISLILSIMLEKYI